MCAASRVVLPACTAASQAASQAHRRLCRSCVPAPRVGQLHPDRRTFAFRRSAAMATGGGAPPLVVVGSVNADLVVESRLPQPGETVAATGGGVTLPGGKGANQAAAAALCGYPTCFVGQTGRDAPAGVLRAALTAAGVDLSHCSAVDAPTGQAIIVLQPDGENSIIIVGGANTAWTAPGAEALHQVVTAGMLLLQREVPESVSLAAARAARWAGVPVILDAGGNEEPICEELLCLVTVLSPNETELSRLTGLPTDSEAHILEAAHALQQRGVDTVLVKLGAQGSLLVPPHNGAPVRQPAFKADKVRCLAYGCSAVHGPLPDIACHPLHIPRWWTRRAQATASPPPSRWPSSRASPLSRRCASPARRRACACSAWALCRRCLAGTRWTPSWPGNLCCECLFDVPGSTRTRFYGSIATATPAMAQGGAGRKDPRWFHAARGCPPVPPRQRRAAGGALRCRSSATAWPGVRPLRPDGRAGNKGMCPMLCRALLRQGVPVSRLAGA